MASSVRVISGLQDSVQLKVNTQFDLCAIKMLHSVINKVTMLRC